MPVFIESYYPPGMFIEICQIDKKEIHFFLGNYDLKYQLFDKLDDGSEEELICALFTLRIV